MDRTVSAPLGWDPLGKDGPWAARLGQRDKGWRVERTQGTWGDAGHKGQGGPPPLPQNKPCQPAHGRAKLSCAMG